MNFSGRIEANQGPLNGPIAGSIVMEVGGRKTTIGFTLVNPESEDVSLAFHRDGVQFADFRPGMDTNGLTAEQRAILQLLPQVLDTSERVRDRNQAMREHGMIERFERVDGVQMDVKAYCDFEGPLSEEDATLVATLFD